MASPPYVTVEEMRLEGVPSDQFNDATVQRYIALAQAFIENACRMWFYSKPCVWELDGTDGDTIFFPVPIISIDEVRINGDPTPLDTTYYLVSKAHGNPTLQLVRGGYDIFTSPITNGPLRFAAGRRNQYIAGNFGWVDEDGNTPILIKRAVTLLAIEKMSNPAYTAAGSVGVTPAPPVTGTIIEEGTDGHYVKYAQAGGVTRERRVSAWASISNNPEVQQIIKMFRPPMAIAAPVDRFR